MLRVPMEYPAKSKREHLRRMVAGKAQWSEPVSGDARAKGFKG
jgi:hypothetical protein